MDKLDKDEGVSIADNFSHSLFDSLTRLLGENQVEIQQLVFISLCKTIAKRIPKCVGMANAGLTINKTLEALHMNTEVARTSCIANSNEIELQITFWLIFQHRLLSYSRLSS